MGGTSVEASLVLLRKLWPTVHATRNNLIPSPLSHLNSLFPFSSRIPSPLSHLENYKMEYNVSTSLSLLEGIQESDGRLINFNVSITNF